jgi:hypothetical protein
MAYRLTVGGVFDIPLSDGRKAYGHYLFSNPHMGTLIRVLTPISRNPVSVHDLDINTELFPPIFVNLKGAIREGIWHVVGHRPVEAFAFPIFVAPYIVGSIENIDHWSLWDGQSYTRLGRYLPKEYYDKEIYIIWSPLDIADRIETGMNPIASWYSK